MNVILLEKVRHLGELGAQVTVRNGYARNYLLPRGLAIKANAENKARFAMQRAVLQQRALEKLQAAQARAEALATLTIHLTVQATDEGRLYGSISVHDLVRAITAAGVTVEKHEIQLLQGPIRQLGEHEISLQLHPDVTTSLKITLVANKV